MYNQYGGSGNPPISIDSPGVSNQSAQGSSQGSSQGSVQGSSQGQTQRPPTQISTGSDKADSMNLQNLLSSVGIQSLNPDDILEGSISDVQMRISNLKMKLDENERLIEEEKSTLDARIKEFNDNLKDQERLYKFGNENGKEDENLFSQLKVYRGSFLYEQRRGNRIISEYKENPERNETLEKLSKFGRSVGRGIGDIVSNNTENIFGIDDLSTNDSKESFMRKLRNIRVFEEEARETRYLEEVKDIMNSQTSSDDSGPDMSLINQGLRNIQDRYITELQQLLNSVGANKPCYTGVKNYVGGYKTENKEGFLQLPVIKNSKRFNDKQTTHIFLTNDTTRQSNIGNIVTAAGPEPDCPSLYAPTDITRDRDGALLVEGAPIRRDRGGKLVLTVSTNDGFRRSQGDFALSKPLDLSSIEIENLDESEFIEAVEKQTKYKQSGGGPTGPPDATDSISRIVRKIYRGEGSYIDSSDPQKCLAGLIPFDESFFQKLLTVDANGLVQDPSSNGITDTTIRWRGVSYSFKAGANNLKVEKERLKQRENNIFPKLKFIGDASESKMKEILELEKLCKGFEKAFLKCSTGNNGWDGLGWLFRVSDGQDFRGGSFNPNYNRGNINRHLTTQNGNIRKVVKSSDNGGLKLRDFFDDTHGVGGGVAGTANNPHNYRLRTRAGDVRRTFDRLRWAYQIRGANPLIGNPVGNLANQINDPTVWNTGDNPAEQRNIATITRRRCILFLFHFLEKAFGATWYCRAGGETNSYTVEFNVTEVYQKLSDWEKVEKWWKYTETAEGCLTQAGANGLRVVCTYNGEKGGAGVWGGGQELYPEDLKPEECLLCFARHLFIGRQNPDANGLPCRTACESEAKVWDVIEEFLPKFYRCAMIIKQKDTIKDFYEKIRSLDKSEYLNEAKNIATQTKAKRYESETKKLTVYPQNIYRNLLVRMYDTEEKPENKKYCCCSQTWGKYVGETPFQITPCNVCSVAHYFYDMPSAITSYDFRGYYDDTCGEVQGGQAGQGDFIGRNLPNQLAIINRATNQANPEQNWQVNPIKNLSYILCNWQLFHSEYNEYLNGGLSVVPMRTPNAGAGAFAAIAALVVRVAQQYHPYVVDTSGNIIKGIPANEYGLWEKNNPDDGDTYDDPQYRIDRVEKRKEKLTAKVKEANALPVITFDKKDGSENFGSYVVNNNYSRQEAEFKLSWPKKYSNTIDQTAAIGNPPDYLFEVKDPEEPKTDSTSGRTLHSQRHSPPGTPPYPIKHLNYKLFLRENAPKYFDMKINHGQAKNILINYISDWESKKEIYDAEKKQSQQSQQTDDSQRDENQPDQGGDSISERTQRDTASDTVAPDGSLETTLQDDTSVNPDGTVVNQGDLKKEDLAKEILSFKEKEITPPQPTSLENAKSKEVVEFSDYQTLETEYDRVKKEIQKRDILLKDLVNSYREKQLIHTSDRTEERLIRQSDNKRRLRIGSKIKELERKQKDQLDFLRITMAKMREKQELYKKQEEELNMLRENQRRSEIESEMNRHILKQKQNEIQQIRDLQVQKLRKRQGKYMGLSDSVANADRSLLKMKSDQTNQFPMIFTETIKSPTKPKRNKTPSKKRANRKKQQKDNKTPKKQSRNKKSRTPKKDTKNN